MLCTMMRYLVLAVIASLAAGSVKMTVQKAAEDMLADPYFMWSDAYDKDQVLLKNGMDWDDNDLHWPSTQELVLLENQAQIEIQQAKDHEGDDEFFEGDVDPSSLAA